MALGFAKQVAAWAKKVEGAPQAILQASVGELAKELGRTKANGGRLPHLTGNLMRSLLGSTAGPPSRGAPGATYAGSDVGAAIAGLQMGQSFWLGFQANYAHRRNYGFVGDDSLGRTYNEAGDGFVEFAEGQWGSIVKTQTATIRKELGI